MRLSAGERFYSRRPSGPEQRAPQQPTNSSSPATTPSFARGKRMRRVRSRWASPRSVAWVMAAAAGVWWRFVIRPTQTPTIADGARERERECSG